MKKTNCEVETFGLVKAARITGIPYHRLYHYFELNILPPFGVKGHFAPPGLIIQ